MVLASGKAIDKIFRNGSRVKVEFIDGTEDEVPHYTVTFVREPQTAAQKELILNLFESADGKRWQRVAGNPRIAAAHVPLGWVPLDWVDVLRELLQEGRVGIQEFEDAAYLVKKG